MDWSKLAGARSLLLTISGLFVIVLGVRLIYPPAGLIACGLALILLAYLTDPPAPGSRR